MSEIVLRPYQNKAVEAIREGIIAGNLKQVFRLDTGGGKTICFSFMVAKAVPKGKKVLILTDRIELLTQAGGSIAKFGIDVRIIDSTHRPHLQDQVYVSMAQTLARRLQLPEYVEYLKTVDLVIIDEAHKSIFDKFFEYFGEKTVVIGATATPIRVGNQKSLENFYQDIIEVANISELINDGFLVPARSFGVQVDLSEVTTKGNDYDQGSMSNFYDDASLYEGAVENYLKHAAGTKALLFCSGIKNSIALRDQFRSKGITAEHLDSESTTKKERIRILQDFKDGKFLVLCNVGILTTGYDEPSIETIILYRATKSLALLLQMVGRGSRLFPGKDFFKVLDFGNNFKTHGLWEEDREWTLQKKKKTKKSKGAAPIKECPKCESFLPVSASICSFCEYVFPAKEEKRTFAILEEIPFDMEKRNVDRFGYFRHLELIAGKSGKNFHWIVKNLSDVNELSSFAKYKKYPKPGAWVRGVLDRRKTYKR